MTQGRVHMHKNISERGGFETKMISVQESVLAQFQKYSLSILTHLWTLHANKCTLGMHVAQVLWSEGRWFDSLGLHVEVSLGKKLNLKLLLMCWSAPCMAATSISVWMYVWMNECFGQKVNALKVNVNRKQIVYSVGCLVTENSINYFYFEWSWQLKTNLVSDFYVDLHLTVLTHRYQPLNIPDFFIKVHIPWEISQWDVLCPFYMSRIRPYIHIHTKSYGV